MASNDEREKLSKLLRLAFDPSATPAEAELAAVMLVRHCRSKKIPFEESITIITASVQTSRRPSVTVPPDAPRTPYSPPPTYSQDQRRRAAEEAKMRQQQEWMRQQQQQARYGPEPPGASFYSGLDPFEVFKNMMGGDPFKKGKK